MDAFKGKLRNLQEAWRLIESNVYVDHIRSHLPAIKASVEEFLSRKVSERVSKLPRSKQALLARKLGAIKIDEIGVYGSAVTGKYQTHPDRPGDIDVFVRISTNIFFQGHEWWRSDEWSRLQSDLALKDIPVDVAIIGKHEPHESQDDIEIIYKNNT